MVRERLRQMQNNPEAARQQFEQVAQSMGMGNLGGAGGMPGFMPPFSNPNPTPNANGTPGANSGNGSNNANASNTGNNSNGNSNSSSTEAQMTEEEMIQEAIRRSLQEQ